MTEDMEQTELRAKDFESVNGPVKTSRTSYAYSLSSRSKFSFMSARDAMTTESFLSEISKDLRL